LSPQEFFTTFILPVLITPLVLLFLAYFLLLYASHSSFCFVGKALFIAPRGRTFEEFKQESLGHGWPSFRDEEVSGEKEARGGSGERGAGENGRGGEGGQRWRMEARGGGEREWEMNRGVEGG
jgi:hypothetical protein